MKSFLMLCLTALLLISSTACDITNAQTPDVLPKVVIVSQKGSLEDQTYSNLAYDGIMRAARDYKMEVVFTEPETDDSYIEAVSEAADGADLVIAVGNAEADEIIKIAGEKPDTLFALVDSQEDAPGNVMCISFKEEEGAFLVGVIAALTSETQSIGFVGGVRDEASAAVEYGFRAGAISANPDIQVSVIYTGCFNDPQEGNKAAGILVEEGVDVIFHSAGQCGDGVTEVADKAGIWSITTDGGKSSQESDTVLCSVFKRIDNGIYLSIQSFMEGSFLSGAYDFGLDFEAVGYLDSDGNIDDEIKARADEFAAAILEGNIIVPKTRQEFNNFKIPETGTL